jgi:hypothetical protein
MRSEKMHRHGRDYRERWGLVSMWEMETGALTVDSHGSNTLTNNNSVAAVAGRVGSAGQFATASSTSLSITDNASLSNGDIDFWAAGWVNHSILSGSTYIALKGANNAVGNHEWYLIRNVAAGDYRFGVSNGVAGTLVARQVPAHLNEWNFWLVWHDAVNDTINLRLNHGAISSATLATGSWDSGQPFRISLASGNFTGLQDQVAYGKQPPTGIASLHDEISRVLYNKGRGVSYADLLARAR